MKIKPGVRVLGLRPEILLAVMAAEPIWTRLGAELVITSGIDGSHTRASKHYTGCALDFRTNALLPEQRETARAELAEALGKDFDVVLESDHLHVEFDPKTAY